MTTKKNALHRYREMRDFEATPEPAGGPRDGVPASKTARKPRSSKRRRGSGLTYVVQRHDARSLHFDFRLELDGTLKSWAVPKGPSLVPGERRLAVEVEDHPLDYAHFEGTIPEGHYGAGKVRIWDEGVWEPEGNPREALEKGHLSFVLEGRRLRGKFTLVRTRTSDGKRNQWLLLKARDAHAAKPGVAKPKAAKPRAAKPHAAKPKAVAKSGAVAKATKSEPIVAGVRITHPDRVLDHGSGLTKIVLAQYYERVATCMLPYITRRPLALVRCPEGDRAECFFQKRRTPGMPDTIHGAKVGKNAVLYVEDERGLVSLAQFGAVEIHGWGARLPGATHPDWIVMDLDPDEGLAFSRVVEAAFTMRESLLRIGLESFVKTTGGKGLHVVVPISPHAVFDEVKEFTHAVAKRFALEEPRRYTATMSKRSREGKIFIDYLRNGAGATAVAPYSARARPGAPVAFPVAWRDLAKVDPRELTVHSVPKILARRRKDPWAELLTLEQRPPTALDEATPDPAPGRPRWHLRGAA